MGGCSIMMWGAFSVQGKSSPVPIRRMKSVDYQGLLQKYLLPFGEILQAVFGCSSRIMFLVMSQSQQKIGFQTTMFKLWISLQEALI